MMLGMPLFIHGQALDWRDECLVAWLEGLCLECRLVPGLEAFVVATDDEAMAARVKDWGVDEVRLVADPEDVSFPEQVAKVCGCDANEPIIGVNYRNPKLKAETIIEAVTRYQADVGFPVVSMIRPEDHPAQLRMHLTLHDAGMLHVLEDEEMTASLGHSLGLPLTMASHPFPLQECLLPTSLQAVPLFAESSQQGLMAVTKDAACSMESGIWYRESPGTARILWCGVARPAGLVACPSGFDGLGYSGASLIREGKAVAFSQPSAQGECYVHLQPVGPVNVPRGKVRQYALVDGRCDLGAMKDGLALYIYSVERVSGDGEYDFERSYDPSGILWSAESGKLANGDMLFGRQNLPPILEIRHSLCVGLADQLFGLENLVRECRFQGVMLDEDQIHFLDTPLDVMRLQVAEWLEVNHVW